MKHFNPDEYAKNKAFRQKESPVYTFFVGEGFNLTPFIKSQRPWKPIGKKNKDGLQLYKTKAIIDFILPDGRVCRIPRGFEWDGASIPKAAQWLIGKPMGKYALAALLHDWLYASRILGTTRKGRIEADELFYTVMEQLRISWWRRKAMYRAVRIGGYYAYFKTDESEHCYNIMCVENKYNPWYDYAEFFKAP